MGNAASVTITAYAHSLSRSCTLGPGQVEFELLAVHPPLARDAALDALAHDDHPAPFAPAVELQLIFDHLAALAALVGGPAPVLPRKLPGRQALHVGGLAQAQQAGLAPALQRQQDAFVAVARVAPDQGLRPAQRVFADHLVHAQRLRGYRVAAQRFDVGIAPVPGQQPKHQRTQHVALVRGVAAAPASPPMCMRPPRVSTAWSCSGWTGTLDQGPCRLRLDSPIGCVCQNTDLPRHCWLPEGLGERQLPFPGLIALSAA